MATWEIALAAGLIMIVQDVLSTAQTQANNRSRASLSGLLDMASWLVTISTTTISVSALQGSDMAKKVAVVASVSAANYAGSVLGVKLGDRFIKREPADAE